MTTRLWFGDIVFSHAMAIFRGQVGDNKLHSHWAAQLTISLDNEFVFETAEGSRSAEVVYVPPKTPHRISSGYICSIYFDALSTATPAMFQQLGKHCAALKRTDLPMELATISSKTDLYSLLTSKLFHSQQSESSPDRLDDVTQALKENLARGDDINRNELAKLVHLSPTRFSHWFVERTGVPLRSYKKWLKLRIVVDAVLAGKGPMEASMLGGFSDLAHMSRAFSESFGFTYMDALRAWQAMHNLGEYN